MFPYAFWFKTETYLNESCEITFYYAIRLNTKPLYRKLIFWLSDDYRKEVFLSLNNSRSSR